MRSKIIGFISLLLFNIISIYAQKASYRDTIFIKENIKIPCKILETSYDAITILYGDSSITKIEINNIENYKFDDIRTYRKNKRAEFKEYSNNTVFFEGFGNGFYSSINYDRVFYRRNDFSSSFRIGFSQFKTGGFIPIELNLFWKARKPACFTELGFGYSPLVCSDYQMSTLFFRIGFRYQQPKGGLFFRAAFLPFYQLPITRYIEGFGNSGSSEGSLIPWYGVSIGYTIPR